MLSVAQAPDGDSGLPRGGTLQRTIHELFALSRALANTDTFNVTTQGDVQQTRMTKESLLVQGLEMGQEHDSPNASVTTPSLTCTGCGESVVSHDYGEPNMHCLCDCCSLVAREMRKQFPGLNRKENRHVSLSVIVDLSSLHAAMVNVITDDGCGPVQSMAAVLKRVGIRGVKIDSSSHSDEDKESSNHCTWYKLSIDPRTIASSDIGKAAAARKEAAKERWKIIKANVNAFARLRTAATKPFEQAEEVGTANKSLTGRENAMELVDKAEEVLMPAKKAEKKANGTKMKMDSNTHKQSLREQMLRVRTSEISFFRDALERIECVLKIEAECRRKAKEEKILRQSQGEFLASGMQLFDNVVHRTFSIFFKTNYDLVYASQAPRLDIKPELLLDAAEAGVSINLQPCGSADDHSAALVCGSATMREQWIIASERQAKDHVSQNAKGFDSVQSFLEAQFVNAKHIAQCIANLTRSHLMTKEMLMINQDQFASLLRALVLRAFQYPDREMQRALCVTFRHLMGHHDNGTKPVNESNQQSRRKEASKGKPEAVETSKAVLEQQLALVRVLKACEVTQSLVHTCRTCSAVKVHPPVRVATAGTPLFRALCSGHGTVYEGENAELQDSTHGLDIQELEEKRASSLLHKNTDAALNTHIARSYKRFYVVQRVKLNVDDVASAADKKEEDGANSPDCIIDGVVLKDGDRVLIKNEVGTTMLHGIWEFHREPRTRSNFEDIAIGKSQDNCAYQRVWSFTRKGTLDPRSFVMVKDGNQNKGLGFLITSGLDVVKESFTPENTCNITVHLSGAFIEPWKLDPLSHSTYSMHRTLLMYITSGQWAGWCGTVLHHRMKSRHEGHNAFSVTLLHSTASALAKKPPTKRVVQVDGHDLVMVHLDETELAIDTLFRFWDFIGATERSVQRSKPTSTDMQHPPTDHTSDEQTWEVLPVEGATVTAPRPWIIKSIHFKEYMVPRFRWCKQADGQDSYVDYTVKESAEIEAGFQGFIGTNENRNDVLYVGENAIGDKIYLTNAAEHDGQKVYRAEITSKSGLKIHCNVVRQERFKITIKFLYGQVDKEEEDVVMDAHIGRIFEKDVTIRAAVKGSSVEVNAEKVTELELLKVKNVTEEADSDRIKYELQREGESGPGMMHFHYPYREDEGSIHTPFSKLDQFKVGDDVKLRMHDNVIRDG
jgi:hypothetical protein